MNIVEEYKIRRSTDPDLMSFERLKLPPPDQVVFREYGLVYVRADHSRVGDGYPSLTWVYDVISRANLYKFVALLGGEDYASVRIRTDTRDAEHAGVETSFKIFDAVMWKPVLSGQEGTSIARSDLAFQTVSINFRKLQEV